MHEEARLSFALTLFLEVAMAAVLKATVMCVRLEFGS